VYKCEHYSENQPYLEWNPEFAVLLEIRVYVQQFHNKAPHVIMSTYGSTQRNNSDKQSCNNPKQGFSHGSIMVLKKI